VLGFLRHEARLRYPALAIFVAVAVKIAVHDLAAASLPQRILATGVLGAVLLTAAFVYSRSQLGEQPGDGTTP